MSNFIGMVFATLKKEGIDTSGMDVNDAVAKYNEIKGADGGQSAKGEETPKATEKTAETADKAPNKDKEAPKVETQKQESNGYKLSESDFTIIDDTMEDGDTKQEVLKKLEKSGFLGANKPQVEAYLDKKMGNPDAIGDEPKFKNGQVVVGNDGEEWEITGTGEALADVNTGRKGKTYIMKSKKSGVETESPYWYIEQHLQPVDVNASKLQKSMGVSNEIADVMGVKGEEKEIANSLLNEQDFQEIKNYIATIDRDADQAIRTLQGKRKQQYIQRKEKLQSILKQLNELI